MWGFNFNPSRPALERGDCIPCSGITGSLIAGEWGAVMGQSGCAVRWNNGIPIQVPKYDMK